MLNVSIIKENENPTTLETAKYLEHLFSKISSIEEGQILIVCDLTCFGFKEKDIDLFVVGKIEKGFLLNNLITNYDKSERKNVFINSFCFIIKEIQSEPSSIRIEGSKILIEQNDKEFDISTFSKTQKKIIYDFLKGTTGIDFFTFDILYFNNLTPTDKVKKDFNTLRSSFTLNHVFQIFLNSGAHLTPNKNKTAFNLYAAKREKLNFDLIEKAISTFGHLKKSIGKLTKRKIDLLAEQFLKGQNYTEQIGKMPVIIRGPAGSGKTMKLIGIAKDLYLQQKRCLFLTYNQSLVKDLTRLITLAEIKSSIPEEAVYIDSIHSFLYKLSDQFGILKVIYKTRENELKNMFDGYRQLVISFFTLNVKHEKITNPSEIKKLITESGFSNLQIKQLHSFLNRCVENNISISDCDLNNEITVYYDGVFSLIKKGLKEHLFINNFFAIRKEILNFLNNGFSFVTNNQLFKDKEFVQFLIKKDIPISDENSALELFKEYILKTIKRIKIWDYQFIDEAQDWHREEREIIYSLFGTANILISDGLKEQLVRSPEYLDWGVFKQQKINTHSVSLTTSLRQKDNLSKFQNEFAKATNVSWNVKSNEKLEKGRIIISTIGFTKEMYNSLNQVGKENNCDCHDSLMFLIPPSLSTRTKEKNVFVNENDEIIDDNHTVDREFVYKGQWEAEWKVSLWDGTKVDKQHISKKSLPLPLNEEHRVYHYESSRGLESWTAVCLEMDDLYENKLFFYESSEGQQTIYSKEEQAKIFAANWCLIAMSRAVDTLVITIRNKDSKFTRILRDITKNLENCVTWIESNKDS
jgi:hypothetical protein